MPAANIGLHGLGDRVKLIRSDLFRNFPGRSYDLIVSNPPYVPEGVLKTLPDEFRAEPGLGFVSGADGLDITLEILLEAPRYLTDHGVLVCEVGESAGRLQEALENVPFLWLEFEHGGGGVFTIGKHELMQSGPEIRSLLDAR